MAKLLPFISEQFNGIIWRIEVDRYTSNSLFVEIRSSDEKQVSFASINLKDGKVNFKSLTTPERWLTGIEVAYNDVLLLYNHATENSPVHKGLTAIDAHTGESLWSNFTYAFDRLSVNGPVLYNAQIQPKKLFTIDVRTGLVNKPYEPEIDIELENSINLPGPIPVSYFKQWIQKEPGKWFDIEPYGNSLDYLQFNNLRIVSLHSNEAGVLKQHLYVINGEKIVYEDIMNDGIQKLQPESFMLYSNYLIYIKNKTELKVVKCRAHRHNDVMRIKVVSLFLFSLLAYSTASFAHTLADSVGFENLNGKKVILHKADPKDNYFSIGRRYKVNPTLIIQFNNNAPIKIGEIVKVPTDLPVAKPAAVAPPKKTVVTQPAPAPVTTSPAATANNSQGVVTEYKVSAGETMFSIAKRFSTTVEDITAFNGLSSPNLVAGQVLKIRDLPPPAPIAPPVRIVAKHDSPGISSQDSSNANKFNADKAGLFEKTEKGVAMWKQDDNDADPAKKLVLHRTAPIGSIVKITNPMSGKTTYAKVVGRLSDNDETKDVILVMTKNVAESIGALDKRVHVVITYGSPVQ